MGYYLDQLAEEQRQQRLAELLQAGELGSFPAFMPQPDYRDARDLGAISTGGGLPPEGYDYGPPVMSDAPPSDMLPPQQFRGESMASTPQRSFIRDLVDKSAVAGITPDQLSKMNMRTTGFQDQGFMDGQQPPPLPQNYIRNERTGKNVPILDMYGQPSQSQPSGPVTDPTRGYVQTQWGKGMYMKGDPTKVVLQDNRIIDLARDTARERAIEKENLQMQKLRAEVAQAQAKPQSALDAARAKILADIEGEQLKSRIPGTAEYERVQKRDAGEKKEQSAWSSAVKQADQMDDYINRIIGEGKYKDKGSKLGFFATGLPGQILQNVGSTEARDLRGDLNRIKAIIGFEELNKMRRESPTGGALGQVTERELEFLQSIEGALDQAQSPEQLEKMLWDVKSSAARLKNDLIKNPPRGMSGGGQAPQKSGAEQQAMLMKEAQDAIAQGAPRDAVMRRLQERLGSQ